MVGQRDVELVLAIEARVRGRMVEYQEENVNIETRVVRDALKIVCEKKREVVIGIEDGRDVKGYRLRGKIRRLEKHNCFISNDLGLCRGIAGGNLNTIHCYHCYNSFTGTD